MSQLNKAAFETTYNDASTGKYKAGQVDGIGSDDHRSLVTDIKDSVVFIEDNVNTDIQSFQQEDFFGLITISGAASGAASSISFSDTTLTNSTEKALGVLALVTGTDTNGRSGWPGAGSTLLLGLGYTLKLKFRLALSALSDGSNTYSVYAGFGDAYSSSGDNTNGCYFRYTHSANSGKWEAVTSGGATRTSTDTGISPTATVFQIFTIIATDSSVRFDIDGTTVSNTDNLPDGGSEFFKLDFKIEKSAGSTSRTMYIDWYDLLITRTTSR